MEETSIASYLIPIAYGKCCILGFVQGILLWSIVTYVAPTYGTVPFPAWGLALGWCMVAVVLVWIPAVAAYKLTREEGSFWKVGVMPATAYGAFY